MFASHALSLQEKERSPRLAVIPSESSASSAPAPKPQRTSMAAPDRAKTPPPKSPTASRVSSDGPALIKSQTVPIERRSGSRSSAAAAESKSPTKQLPSVAKPLPRRSSSSAVGAPAEAPAPPAKKSPLPERKSPQSVARPQSHRLDHLLDDESDEERHPDDEREALGAEDAGPEEEEEEHRTSELLSDMDALEAQIDAMVVSPPAHKRKPLPPPKK